MSLVDATIESLSISALSGHSGKSALAQTSLWRAATELEFATMNCPKCLKAAAARTPLTLKRSSLLSHWLSLEYGYFSLRPHQCGLLMPGVIARSFCPSGLRWRWFLMVTPMSWLGCGLAQS